MTDLVLITDVLYQYTLRLVDATARGVEGAQGGAVDSDHLRLDDLS